MAIIGQAWQQAAIFAVWKFLVPDVPVGILVGAMALWLIIGIGLYLVGTRALKKQTALHTTMVGSTGTSAGKLSPQGMVKIHGELWGAVSEEGDIAPGEEIVVTGEQGLKLRVRRVTR